MASSSTPAPVALVGFMGSGKSAVGRALAAVLGLPFVDCDEVISETAGPIPDIMAQSGEAGFRAIERTVTLDALERSLVEPCVVALGGGAVLDGDVREALKRLPHVAWLTAPVGVMWERVRRAGLAGRPLAHDEAGFARLYEERVPLYEKVASLVVVNDGSMNLAEVAASLLARMATIRADRARERRAGSGAP